MKVRVEYKNKNLQTVGYDDFDVDIYCQKLSQDLTRIISDIERYFEEQYEQNGIESNDLFRFTRHKLLDIAGSIKRLPANIIFDNYEDDFVQDNAENLVDQNQIEIEPKKKATLSNIFSIFGRGD